MSESADELGLGIHQVLVSASPGDAITNIALAIRELLRQVGKSEIYAHHISPAVAHEVKPLSAYRTHHVRDLLIFHASIGQREVHDFLSDRLEPIVLVYHNVTPAEFFEPYDPIFAELLELGRREVELLRPHVVCALADSAFNARELEAMGYRDVRVVPPTAGLHRLAGVEPREQTMNHLAGLDGPILLNVAQMLPHKRPDFLVEMMHIAATYLGMHAFLLLVGHHRLPRYARAVREQVRELNLARVHVVGAVDEADLVAMFRSASAVVTASEHEGFCLPLLEAMTFDKPVIARAWAAIPETVGDAALLLPPHEGPTFMAEAASELLANTALSEHLVARGRARLAEIDEHSHGAAIVEALLEVV